MRIQTDGITIYFEQEEIRDLWNIVEFALDWQVSEVTKDKPKMNKDELELANKLCNILEELK